VSRLPQLEAQLVAAAAARRPRARRPLLIAAGALAVAACVIVALLLAPTSRPQRRDRPVAIPETVPASTLVKARKLTRMPKPPDVKIRDDQIVAVARRAMALMPYPPGMRDEFDWFAHRRVLSNSSGAVRGAVEYHAYCSWVRYWVSGADRAGATAVLEQTPYWPMLLQRGHVTYWHKKITNAAREGDVVTMRREATLNCRAVR
jgi:hypothetical protein